MYVLDPLNIFKLALEVLHNIFLRHGGRKTISTEDVMLLTRRNEALAAELRKAGNKDATATKKPTKKR